MGSRSGWVSGAAEGEACCRGEARQEREVAEEGQGGYRIGRADNEWQRRLCFDHFLRIEPIRHVYAIDLKCVGTFRKRPNRHDGLRTGKLH